MSDTSGGNSAISAKSHAVGLSRRLPGTMARFTAGRITDGVHRATVSGG